MRILIDDEGNSASDAAGVPTTQGVYLSNFDPIPLPAGATNNTPSNHGGGRALWRILDNNTAESNSYNEGTSPRSWNLQQQNGASVQADTVRGIKKPPAVKTISNVTKVSAGIKITANNHGLNTNDQIFIANVLGATQANGGWTITKVDANTFTLNGTGATTLSAYSTNGSIWMQPASTTRCFAMPYGSSMARTCK